MKFKKFTTLNEAADAFIDSLLADGAIEAESVIGARMIFFAGVTAAVAVMDSRLTSLQNEIEEFASNKANLKPE